MNPRKEKEMSKITQFLVSILVCIILFLNTSYADKPGLIGAEYDLEDFGFSPSPKKVPGSIIDLSGAQIVVLNPKSKIMTNAADMLHDEIEKRTRISLDVVEKRRNGVAMAIVIGTGMEIEKNFSAPAAVQIPDKADGYAIWVSVTKTKGVTVCLAGHDERGTLYAAGRLLRLLNMERNSLSLSRDIKIATAPKYALRGHQLGYRAKTNSYDAWTVDMWEQYYRDMIVFGMNAVEIVPPVTDDLLDSPVMPNKPMDIMIAQSQLAADYGLELWIWYPVMEFDDVEKGGKVPSKLMELAIKNRHDVLSQLPRVDAVFVPSGDPGEIHPTYLFPHLKELKKVLNKYHPNATVWSSIQNYDDEKATMGWIKAFYNWLNEGKADWLEGVVFGPATETTLPQMRKDVPQRFPIRRYPDITHSKSCQYEIDDWDNIWKNTLGREPINPRPRAFAKIFRDIQQYSIGFISYSEGCNDDLNKIVWSCLGWDPDMKVDDILLEYSKYFISKEYAETFAAGLLGLENNWVGSAKDNKSVDKTLALFQAMENNATPQDKLNWRFQQGLYRAYYDAYIKNRYNFEQQLEKDALAVLKTAGDTGSEKAIGQATAILKKAEDHKVNSHLRARVYELAEALFQSIRMQLSVPRYRAKQIGRGANLDLVDIPLNNSVQLLEMFEEIGKMDSEQKKLDMLSKIAANDYKKKEYDWEEIYEEEFLRKGLMIDD